MTQDHRPGARRRCARSVAADTLTARHLTGTSTLTAYHRCVAKRPTDLWLDAMDEPDARWRATDEALRLFERDLAQADVDSDDEVLEVMQSVVEALNDVNADFNAFDVIDRGELCGFIDEAMSEAGVDLDGLAERRDVDRADLTDEWRDW